MTKQLAVPKPPKKGLSYQKPEVTDSVVFGDWRVKSNPMGKLVPDNFHDYQIDMARHLNTHAEAMLWIFMGGGKSIVTLSSYLNYKAHNPNHKMIIIAPLLVCNLTWRQEAEKWLHTEDIKFSMVTGTAKQRQTALFRDADIYLTNYESLEWLKLQLETYYVNQGIELPFQHIVFDEISKMKRPESNRYKEFEPMLKYFKYRVGLTGSPASNGLINVWSQFYCLDLGKSLGASYQVFKQRFFHHTGGQRGKFIPYEGELGTPSSLEMIVDNIAPITLEVRASGNIELPELLIIDRMVTLTPKLMKGYLELELEFMLAFKDVHGEDAEVEVFNASAISMKLRGYVGGRMYITPDPDFPEIREVAKVHNLKMNELDVILDEIGDESVFLSYQFSSERDEILKKYPDARCLTGTSPDEGDILMNDFNGGRLKFLLSHELSAGYGLNLQENCSVMIQLGISWNLESTEQWIARVHRQGNKNSNVRLFRILARDTVDIMMSERLVSKDATQQQLRDKMQEHISNRSK